MIALLLRLVRIFIRIFGYCNLHTHAQVIKGLVGSAVFTKRQSTSRQSGILIFLLNRTAGRIGCPRHIEDIICTYCRIIIIYSSNSWYQFYDTYHTGILIVVISSHRRGGPRTRHPATHHPSSKTEHRREPKSYGVSESYIVQKIRDRESRDGIIVKYLSTSYDNDSGRYCESDT
jgi:hypothetical protein